MISEFLNSLTGLDTIGSALIIAPILIIFILLVVLLIPFKKNKIKINKNSPRETILSYIENGRSFLEKGDIDNAQKMCSRAVGVYYKLPLEEENLLSSIISKFGEEIEHQVRELEVLEIKKISDQLEKIQDLEHIYIIDENGNIGKKLEEILKYSKEVQAQGIYSIKAGKTHLKNKVTELVKKVQKIEEDKKPIKPKHKEAFTAFKKLAKTVQPKEFTQNELPDPPKIPMKSWKHLKNLSDEHDEIVEKIIGEEVEKPKKSKSKKKDKKKTSNKHKKSSKDSKSNLDKEVDDLMSKIQGMD